MKCESCGKEYEKLYGSVGSVGNGIGLEVCCKCFTALSKAGWRPLWHDEQGCDMSMEWISFLDKTPPEGKAVLVATKGCTTIGVPFINTAYTDWDGMIKNVWSVKIDERMFDNVVPATHWLPIPERPFITDVQRLDVAIKALTTLREHSERMMDSNKARNEDDSLAPEWVKSIANQALSWVKQ